MSSTVSTATPSTPTSPSERAWSESSPIRVGMSKAVESPCWPCLEQVAEALVGLLDGPEAGELAHRPEPAAVHRRVDAAGERVLAGVTELLAGVEALEILVGVERLDRVPESVSKRASRSGVRRRGPPATGVRAAAPRARSPSPQSLGSGGVRFAPCLAPPVGWWTVFCLTGIAAVDRRDGARRGPQRRPVRPGAGPAHVRGRRGPLLGAIFGFGLWQTRPRSETRAGCSARRAELRAACGREIRAGAHGCTSRASRQAPRCARPSEP